MTRNKKASPLLSNNEAFLLFYQDSNLDKQDQNLLCCHYTIGQYFDGTKLRLFFVFSQINLKKIVPKDWLSEGESYKSLYRYNRRGGPVKSIK